MSVTKRDALEEEEYWDFFACTEIDDEESTSVVETMTFSGAKLIGIFKRAEALRWFEFCYCSLHP